MIDTSLGVYLVTYGELRELVRAGGRDSERAHRLRATLADMDQGFNLDQKYIIRETLKLLD